jgi:succinylglutamate desuccinylase
MENALNIPHALAQFRNNQDQFEYIDQDAFCIPATESRKALAKDRIYDLTILAMTHGNEVAGIAIINEIVQLIISGQLKTNANIGCVIGNAEAALQNKRFVESDLNRSFGQENVGKTIEQKRALKLKQIFNQSAFLLDLHQTQGACAGPFLISRYDPMSFRIFNAVAEDCPAVIYGGNFSDSGVTTVNYHLQNGGWGFGLELGEKGFDPAQISFGVRFVKDLLHVLSIFGSFEPSQVPIAKNRGVAFTFAETITGQIGVFNLKPGLANMQVVHKSEVLGSNSGRSILAPQDGRLLFPKYPTATDLMESKGKEVEVLRFLRRVADDDIEQWEKTTK